MKQADDIAKRHLSKRESDSTTRSATSSTAVDSRNGGTPTEHAKRVSSLFARLRSIYRHKARDMVPTVDGQPTMEFRLWCQKTAHLTDQQFAQGVAMMERQEMDARKTGDETWPPSYAGFIGLATMSTKPRSTVTALPAPTDKQLAAERMAKIRELLH